jgi:hypothetical protein
VTDMAAWIHFAGSPKGQQGLLSRTPVSPMVMVPMTGSFPWETVPANVRVAIFLY